MPQYRKKPIAIEAYQPSRHAVEHDWYSMPQWVRDAYERGDLLFPAHGFTVKTLEGQMAAKWGDYLIQGVQGELYPCKESIFLATYEPVEGGE